MRNETVIFCDFDGTITTEDTLEAFIQLFMEEDIRLVGKEMVKKGYSVKQGIKELMGQIRSRDYAEHTGFFQNLPIRDGFQEFIDYTQKQGIPVVVLSGGIQAMSEQALAPYHSGIKDIWAGKVDLSGQFVRFYSDYETESELVGKVNIMKKYHCQRKICIGDSYTDMEMAQAADVVFARDRLAAALNRCGKEYFTYNSFHDIIAALKLMDF